MLLLTLALAAPSASFLPEKRHYCRGEEVLLQVTEAPETDQLVVLYGLGDEWTSVWSGPMEDGRLRVQAFPEGYGMEEVRFRVAWAPELPPALLEASCRRSLDEAGMAGVTYRDLVLESHYSCERVAEPKYLQVDLSMPRCGGAAPLVLPQGPAPSPERQAPREVFEAGGARIQWEYGGDVLRGPLDGEGEPTLVLEGVDALRCRPGSTCMVVGASSLLEWDPSTGDVVEGGIRSGPEISAGHRLGEAAMSWVGDAFWVSHPEGVLVYRRGAEPEARAALDVADYARDVFDIEPTNTTFHAFEGGELRSWSLPRSIQQRDGDHLELSLFEDWQRGDTLIPKYSLVRVALSEIDDGPVEVLLEGQEDSALVEWAHVGSDLVAYQSVGRVGALVRVSGGEVEVLVPLADSYGFSQVDGALYVMIRNGYGGTWVRVGPDVDLTELDGTPYRPEEGFALKDWGTMVRHQGEAGPVLVAVGVGDSAVPEWSEDGILLTVRGGSYEAPDPTRMAVAAAEEAVARGWAQPGKAVLLAPPDVAIDALAHFPGTFAAAVGRGSLLSRVSNRPLRPGSSLLLLGTGGTSAGELQELARRLGSEGADVQWSVVPDDGHVTPGPWLKERTR